MSSGKRCLHHSKLNHSLDRSNYQILWPFSADNFYAYYNPGYTISISFSCVFVALLMWFNVVATNIVNHYHFIYNLSWNENIKKTRRYQLICFIFINLHNIQYIIYILLLTYYRISNTDTINELYKQTKIKVVFDTKTHVSITFLILFSSSRL